MFTLATFISVALVTTANAQYALPPPLEDHWLTSSVALWDKGMFGYNYPDAAGMSNLFESILTARIRNSELQHK